MARRSQRLSTGPGNGSIHKRTASKTEIADKVVKRPRKQQATPVKSQYFSASGDEGHGDDTNDEESEDSVSLDEQSESAFEGEGSSNASSEGNDSEDDAFESEDSSAPRKKGRSSKGAAPSRTASKGSEIWRPGVKTGLGPGREVIIKKPKARPAGKTPYRDGTIHPNTFLFLADLKRNNNRDWLKLNDPDFRASERDWYSFVECMTQKLIETDDTIPELPVKDVIFRIYRDIRFSKDPTPYKAHFSANWSRSGRKGSYASYYLQIAPNNSVCGGMWMPEADRLDAIRQDIDRSPAAIRDVLSNERLSKEFLGLPKSNRNQAVKAFVKANFEGRLKTKPKGYAADHPDIELMRLKNFAIRRKLEDSEVLGEAGMHRVAELFACLKPLVTYLNSVVMPDAQAEENDDEDDDEDDEDDGAEDNGEGQDEETGSEVE